MSRVNRFDNAMSSAELTIKELTVAVGGGVTPRMVRHYHQIGLLPQPTRSTGNYRLYNDRDVQRLQTIVAFKQQGFQLSHIQKLLDAAPDRPPNSTPIWQLQQQYQTVIQQIAHLRHTATALEGLLGRDLSCQQVQAAVLAQINQMDTAATVGFDHLEQLWDGLDVAISSHPESFTESLQRLLPDLSDRSAIEVDLLSKLVLACGDVSLVQFVKLGNRAIEAGRSALLAGCTIITDAPPVTAALDLTRLAHLNCITKTLVEDVHLNSAAEVEREFWHHPGWQQRLDHVPDRCILVVGCAPSALLAICQAIEQNRLHPALVIGMPIGFSHAPAAKRKLMRLSVPFVTISGTLGGGLLAATALNAIADSLLEKPDCHCHLTAHPN